MTMITPSYLGETIEYSSLHACRSTLEDPTSCGSGGRVPAPHHDGNINGVALLGKLLSSGGPCRLIGHIPQLLNCGGLVRPVGIIEGLRLLRCRCRLRNRTSAGCRAGKCDHKSVQTRGARLSPSGNFLARWKASRQIRSGRSTLQAARKLRFKRLKPRHLTSAATRCNRF